MTPEQEKKALRALKPFQPVMGVCAAIAIKGKRYRWLSGIPINAVGFVASRWIRWKVYGRLI
jgi:hypothetical protein